MDEKRLKEAWVQDATELPRNACYCVFPDFLDLSTLAIGLRGAPQL